MEHVKKYVFVPEDTLARMGEQSKPFTTQAQSMDDDMISIMDNQGLSPYEKWRLYAQTLNKYMQYREAARRPVKLDVVDENPPEVEQPQHEHILATIPDTHRPKAEHLLNRLLQEPTFTVHPNLDVSINEQKIVGANIVDLLSDAVRKRRNVQPAIGWEQFRDYLRTLNVPREWIGNSERYLKTPQPSTTRRQASPLSSTPRRSSARSRRKLDITGSKAQPWKAYAEDDSN